MSSQFGVDFGDPNQYEELLRHGRRFIPGRSRPRYVRKNPFASLEYQHYDEIKAKCEEEGILFEDPEFEAVDTSLFFSQEPPRPFEWLRPSVSTLLQPSAFSSVLDVWLFVTVNKRPHGVSTLLQPPAFASVLDVWLFVNCK